MNQVVARSGEQARGMHLLSGAGSSPMALLRTDAADARFARHATVALLNTDLDRARTVDPASIISAIDGTFGPWEPEHFRPGQPVTLQPGELRSFTAPATSARAASPPPVDAEAATNASPTAPGSRSSCRHPVRG